ncbi:NADH-quinone oxidoreductase subunit I [Methanosarcinales archaeon]|nr:NADH-quinone oxidoreductase subunit I [Methanosarcinales archaeon]
MLEILNKTLKAGCQTTKYPDVPDVAPVGFRGKPELISDKCTFCGECIKACPPGVIRLTENSVEKILSLSYCGCIFCGRCEQVCKYGAVKLTQEYELSSKTKEDLVTSIRRRL